MRSASAFFLSWAARLPASLISRDRCLTWPATRRCSFMVIFNFFLAARRLTLNSSWCSAESLLRSHTDCLLNRARYKPTRVSGCYMPAC